MIRGLENIRDALMIQLMDGLQTLDAPNESSNVSCPNVKKGDKRTQAVNRCRIVSLCALGVKLYNDVGMYITLQLGNENNL